MQTESETKNVKISREAHYLLKLEAAINGTSIGELASLAIVQHLEKRTGARLLAEHQKGMLESSIERRRDKMPDLTKR